MIDLPPSLEPAFQATAAELGWCSASRLFVRELAAAGGPELVAQAVDRLGRDYPVFACVAALDTSSGPSGVAAIVSALAGVTRLVVVGLESDFLDELVPRLAGIEIGLVTVAGGGDPDWRRVLANYDGRVVALDLALVQRWAGRKSALMTFVYGADQDVAHVAPAWLRVSGPDVRTQFRELVGWDVLGEPMSLYPRWLVPTNVTDFSHLVGP